MDQDIEHRWLESNSKNKTHCCFSPWNHDLQA